MNKIHKGFTIVEVLIALTVLSFALGLGYATAGKSNQALQANAEQYQAQQVANQQIEYLRATNAGLVSGARNNFNGAITCFKNTTGVLSVVTGSECQNRNAGGADIYTITIKCVDTTGYVNCNTNPNVLSTYSVVVTWYTVAGEESRLELQYAM